MKTSKLVEMLKKGNFVVPLYLFQIRDKFKLEMEEFIFLIYLTNLGDKVLFDVNKFSNDLNMSVQDVLVYVDDLTEKKYITVDAIKNDRNIVEEYVVLDLFYDKLTNIMIDNFNNEKVEEEKNSNVFEAIEKEFARPITPVEYQIIEAWLESGTSEELILEALKEAVYSGVTSLRYIDKILFEWEKKGIKNRDDVDKNRKNFKQNQDKKEKLELFDYDWFDDEDD